MLWVSRCRVVQHRATAQLPRRSDAGGVRKAWFGEVERGRIINRGLKPQAVLNRGAPQITSAMSMLIS